MIDYPTPVFVRPRWYDQANCADAGPGAFYVERGISDARARAICHGCEVRLECLELALERGERFGVWGGLSTRQRSRMRMYRRRVS